MPFEEIGRRAFSFFPAIVGIEHNQWVLQRVTWAEVEVRNKKSSLEISIPRRFVGEVSATGEPFLIVGLMKELEYKEGRVWPHQRRVIEMPRAVNGAVSGFMAGASMRPVRGIPQPRPAPVIGIRLEPVSPVRGWRRIAACVALALMLIAAGVLAWVQAVGSRLRGARDASRPAAAERTPFQATRTW
jgi:hypothetical protein